MLRCGILEIYIHNYNHYENNFLIILIMSSIRKLNKMPVVVQKLDPKLLELKKVNVDMRITIHKLNKMIAEQKKKNNRYRSIIRKMDCVVHVLSETSSKKFFIIYLIILFRNVWRGNFKEG